MPLIRRIGVGRVLMAVALVVLVIAGGAAHAAPSFSGATVTMIDFQFDPDPLTVAVGTTVTWTNTGKAAHTATADTGAFNTGAVAPGQSKSITFNTAGTFAYYCKFHGGPGSTGMAGTIIVTAAQPQPAPAPVLPNTGGSDRPVSLIVVGALMTLIAGFSIRRRVRRSTRCL